MTNIIEKMARSIATVDYLQRVPSNFHSDIVGYVDRTWMSYIEQATACIQALIDIDDDDVLYYSDNAADAVSDCDPDYGDANKAAVRSFKAMLRSLLLKGEK